MAKVYASLFSAPLLDMQRGEERKEKDRRHPTASSPPPSGKKENEGKKDKTQGNHAEYNTVNISLPHPKDSLR